MKCKFCSNELHQGDGYIYINHGIDATHFVCSPCFESAMKFKIALDEFKKSLFKSQQENFFVKQFLKIVKGEQNEEN